MLLLGQREENWFFFKGEFNNGPSWGCHFRAKADKRKSVSKYERQGVWEADVGTRESLQLCRVEGK